MRGMVGFYSIALAGDAEMFCGYPAGRYYGIAEMADRPTHDDKGYPLPRRKLARGWRPNPPRPMDEARKRKFLEHLAQHGIVGEAARAASPHSHRGCMQTFHRERKRDPKFAEAWDEALELARSALEYEIHRRGVEGVDEPVFFKGEECGTVKRYSDQLLLARIRKLDPEYRQTHRVEHAGTVSVRPIGLDQLTQVQREHLRQILAISAQDAEFSVAETPLLQDATNSEEPVDDGGFVAEDTDDGEEIDSEPST